MNSIKMNEHRNAIQFSGCTLDPETQTLQTQSGVVRLRSKLWHVLSELVTHSNRLVLREDLVKDIWRGNNYTGEQGLTHAICHLRRILKNHQVDARIITLPKKGYILQRETEGKNHDTLIQASTTFSAFPQTNVHMSTMDFDISYNFS